MPDYSDIKKRLAELAALRDRANKKRLTNDERIKILEEIYEGLLFFWQQQVIVGSAKGTGAVSFQLERARLEIEQLKRGSHTIQGAVININFRQVEKAPEEDKGVSDETTGERDYLDRPPIAKPFLDSDPILEKVRRLVGFNYTPIAKEPEGEETPAQEEP